MKYINLFKNFNSDHLSENKKEDIDPKLMPQKSDRLGKGGSFDKGLYGNIAKEDYLKLLRSKDPKKIKKVRLIFPSKGWEKSALSLIKKLGVITGVYEDVESAKIFIASLIKKGVIVDELIIGSHGKEGTLLMTKSGKKWSFDNTFLDSFKPLVHKESKVFFTACHGADYLETIRDASFRLGVPVYGSAGIYNYVTNSSEKGFYMCYPKKLSTPETSKLKVYNVTEQGVLNIRYTKSGNSSDISGINRVTVDSRVFGVQIGPIKIESRFNNIGSDQMSKYSGYKEIHQTEIDLRKGIQKALLEINKYDLWDKKMNSLPVNPTGSSKKFINDMINTDLIKVELQAMNGTYINIKKLPQIAKHKEANNKYLLDHGYCKRYDSAPVDNWVTEIVKKLGTIGNPLI